MPDLEGKDEPAAQWWPTEHYARAAGSIRQLPDQTAMLRRDGHILLATASELPADSVIVVTDERMCERAARTYYRHELGPMPAGGVTVLRVGNRYVVSGAIRAGEWTITTVYSAQLEGIVSILM